MSNQLAEALRWALAWIDAVPANTQLPEMPGFDRDFVEGLLAAHEAAKPEPVAWPSGTDIADEIDALLPVSMGYSTRAAVEVWWRDLVARKLSKLAAPVAVASPLSDEMLDRLEDGCWDGPGLGARFDKRKFARAIEAAHGIKETT